MGITGLLPFLKNASRQVNMRDYKGCTVAVDSYCWLHKGAFSCAGRLAMGEKTDSYVYYCMKFVNMLLSFDIKPVMVFDGCNLPSKQGVEKDRREKRQQYRKKAAQFLREGKKKEATECFQRCVDITSEMALELMKACRAKGVDCVVAPYEADAQLAYLNKIGIADIIITEDSDLILFGCERVVYKLDRMGNGIMIEKDSLGGATHLRNYSFDRFRYMCILSGCDYLPSLPGIGLGKASKLMKVSSNPEFTQTLRKIPTLLKLNVKVTDDYVNGFVKADNTFLYQLVFDPLRKKVVPLNPYPDGIRKEDLSYAGSYLPSDLAYQMALGNVDVKNKKVLDRFNPETYKPPPKKGQTWNSNNSDKPLPPHRQSMWKRSFKPRKYNMDVDPSQVERSSTKGQEVTVKMKGMKSPPKRAREAIVCDDTKSDSELTSMYEGAPPAKKLKMDENENMTIDDVLQDEFNPFQDLLNAIDEEKTADDITMEADDEMEDADGTEEQENCQPSTLEEESPNPKKSWKPPRNIFAVAKEPKKERFNLDRSKDNVEVRSRFFSDKPLTKKKSETFLDCMDCHEVIRAEDGAKKADSDRLDARLNKLVSPKQEKIEEDTGRADDHETEEVTECPQDVSQDNEDCLKTTKKIKTHAFSWGKFKSKFSKGANVSKLSAITKAGVNKDFKPVTPKITTLLSSFKGKSEKESNNDESEQKLDLISDMDKATGTYDKSPAVSLTKKQKSSKSDLRTLFKASVKTEETSLDNDSDCCELEVKEYDYKDYLQGLTGAVPSGTSVSEIDQAETSLSGTGSPAPKTSLTSASPSQTSLSGVVSLETSLPEAPPSQTSLTSASPSQTSLADSDPSRGSFSMYSIDTESINFSQRSLLEEESNRSKVGSLLDLDEDSNDIKIMSVTQPTSSSAKKTGFTPLAKKLSSPPFSQAKVKPMSGCRSSGLSKSKGRSKTIKKNIENDPSQKNITNFFSQFKLNKNVEKIPTEKVPLSPSKINIPTSMTPEIEKSCDMGRIQRRLVV